MVILPQGSLGDQVLLTGIIREYARQFPEERLSVQSKRYQEIFLNNPRLGRGSKDNGVIYQMPVAPPRGNWAMTYGNALGVRVFDHTPEVFLTREEKLLYPKRDNVVVIDTWAGWPNRRWPLDRFKSLVDMLHERGMRVIEVGKFIQDCCYQMRHAALPNVDESLVDKQTVREMAALLFNSRLYIGNASGILHLATAVGTTSISLCSSAVSWAMPYRTSYSLFSTRGCKECQDKKTDGLCHDKKFCMEDITPEDVMGMCQVHGLLEPRNAS